MAQLSTHLTFNGNCEEAFTFYKSVFGGEYDRVMRNNDAPPGAQVPQGSKPNSIMHISLPIGGESMLMGCDMPDAYGPTTFGTNFNIAINTGSNDETTKIFDGLAAGGKVVMPLENTFWGAYFGMVKDKYGIQWMISNETAG